MPRRIAATQPRYPRRYSRKGPGFVAHGSILALLFLLVSIAPSSAQQPTPSAAEEAAALADERDPEAWPRVLEEGSFLIKTYPPQFDEWDGSEIKAHAAIEISEQDKEGST
ncbi:MAG: hypothetical protein WBP17_08170, partial [Gemmatimonadota bacterium]